MRRTPHALIVGLLLACATYPSAAAGQTLPAGFQQGAVFTGLTQPTAVKFASDGRVFVAEKSGLIKVFTNLSDTTPTSSSTCAPTCTTTGIAGCLASSSIPISRRARMSTCSIRSTRR